MVPILAARRPIQEDAGADSVLDALTTAPRVVVEVPNADHGSFSDDPGERRLLGTDTAEHRNTHSLVAQTVLGFLQATLVSGDPFNRKELAERYRARGLRADLSPAAAVNTKGDDSKP